MVVLAAAGVVAACLELSGPQSGLSSVSPLVPAWPSVVVNDVLRDIAGVQAPLHIDVFDGDGNAVTDATVTFVVLDEGVRVEPGGVVRGLTVRDTKARIIGHVSRGGDILQTPEIQLDVVPRPDSVAPARDTTYDPVGVLLADPTLVALEPLRVTVLNRGGAPPIGVRSWLVRYEILSEPAGVGGLRTARFTDGGNTNASVSFDTTDTNGEASRTIAVQAIASDEPTRQNVRVLVTVGNTRPGHLPTMFFITLPVEVGQ
jgi:hypothetical protein